MGVMVIGWGRFFDEHGTTLNGRGKTAPAWFRGVPPDNLPDDDVPDKPSDFAFGRELSYERCEPSRVTEGAGYTTWRQDKAVAHGRASNEGAHVVTVSGTNLPSNGSAFELDITYTGPRTAS